MVMKAGFIDQLRQAIRDSGLSQYRLAKLSGIQQSQLSRFMNGERGLSIDGIEIICKLIGARLVMDTKPVMPKRKGK